MTIFSKTKKTTTPSSPPPPYQPVQQPQQQQQPALIYTSQANLLSPYYNAPSSSSLSLHRPNSAPGQHGTPPPSQGWAPAVPYQPVHLTQNYYLSPPIPVRPKKSHPSLGKLKLGSSPKFEVPPCVPGAAMLNNGIAGLQQGANHLDPDAPLYNQICHRFNTILTQIDAEQFSEAERDVGVSNVMWQQQQQESQELVKGKSKGMVNNSVSTALTNTNYFAKVNLYANSRLPPNLPPMKLFLPTFPLLGLAAQYSEQVYSKPSGGEKETHVDADWRGGTKAMVIKSLPMDDMNTIVFAIRGTQTFMDWAVNLNTAPVSPVGFLDDPGNLCHSGFLSVAKKMIDPVAARLEFLIREDPGRSRCSLLITGHSAGGAVAALLYSHMLSVSTEATSRLTKLTSFFKRVHCVTFGAPPVTLLPLQKRNDPSLKKSLFFSFINEGDPVARADKAYVRSLLDLYTTPPPGHGCIITESAHKLEPYVASLAGKSSSTLNLTRPSATKSKSYPPPVEAPIWRVPESTLSNAGRLVLLRSVERYEVKSGKKKTVQQRMDEGVVAQMVTDERLRGVVWGDPVQHMMKLYARRIEILATNAVMGRG